MSRVFLSHGSSDKKLVTRIARDIEAAGIEVWLDSWGILPGDSISQEIQKGLDESDLVVVALSRRSVRSGWVEKEWQSRIGAEAASRNVQIIPVLLEDCDIPPLLRDKAYADFTEDYEAGLERLTAAVQKHAADGPAQPAPPARREAFEARLVVARVDGALTARWHAPDEGAPFGLGLPLAGGDLDDLRWYLEKFMEFPGYGDRVRARDIETRMAQWGEALAAALFDNRDGGAVLRDLTKAAAVPRPVLMTIASDDAEVLGQPWELLRDSKGPLAFQGIGIRRQLRETRDAGAAPGLDLPLRVLLIVSRPSDTGFIDPRNSIAPMLDALDALGPGQLELEFCDPPTFARLEARVSEARRAGNPFHIVHFDGHGTFLPKTGLGALAFEKDDETTDLVEGPRLGDLMVRQGVPLVLLEACRGADLSDRPVFGSVAPALLRSGVGSVIAFSHSVHVAAARLLVERFYRELAGGMSVGESLAESRRALHADRARWLHLGPDAETIDLDDWFIPQLYQVGEDPVLAAGAAPAGAGEAPSESDTSGALDGFPPAPVYRFHGRAEELLALERAFRGHNAVLLHAMGGMGKTALAREAAAWWLRTGRIEAAVFVSFERRGGPEQVIQRLGAALDGEGFAALAQDEQRRRAIELFRERKALLVWDNFESTLPAFQDDVPAADGEADGLGVYSDEARADLAALYRELTDGAPAGRLLVTCRPEETGLAGIKEIALAGLARPDSLHLLAAVLDAKSIDTERPGYERAEIDRLLDALADHPLSIALVAPHLETLTPETIRTEFGTLVAGFADGAAEEARNSSLLASLEFSKRRLGAEARAVLPYLAWFQGGVFEQSLIAFAELDPERWQAIRAELEATALIRAETLPEISTPYLRFHPTLPFAARPSDVPDPEEAETSFIALYLAVMRMVDGGLRGSQPAAAMQHMALEEANFRAAIRRAFGRGARREGHWMADTLQSFLLRAGRLQERDDVVSWVRERTPADEALDETSCAAIRQHAWTRLTQGHADEAVATIEDLISRLQAEVMADGANATFQIAVSHSYLGRVLIEAGRPDRAVAPLTEAIDRFEGLGDSQRANLSATLGDLANALRSLGRLGEALETAERGLATDRDLGHDREVATGLGQTAAILVDQQRYAEADARYTEALSAARQAGDIYLQGSLLQHHGSLHLKRGDFDRAIELYQLALQLFRQSDDKSGEMRTASNLGAAERNRGELDAAEAWYARARELAEHLGDRRQIAITAQNLGILFQERAEQAEEPVARETWLRRAVDSVEESLAIKLEMDNRPGAASSYSQLGVLHRFLGELDDAERNAREALAIRESLGLPDVYIDYNTLDEIARERGDEAEAAAWQAKRDAKLEEVERLRSGGGEGKGVAEDAMKAIVALVQAVFQARGGGGVPAEVAEALARLKDEPAPFDAMGGFLQAVADGAAVPAVPAGLPEPFGGILDALAKAVRDAGA